MLLVTRSPELYKVQRQLPMVREEFAIKEMKGLNTLVKMQFVMNSNHLID
jgi:hypothetical protein